MTARRLSALLVFVALAFGLVACGGSDEEESGSASAPVAQDAAGDGGAPQVDAGKQGAGGEADGEDPGSAGSAGGAGADGGGGSGDESEVDLSVDPGRIRGAVVTETGAVQTLEPDPEDHDTAQENSYSSIKAFGEEAEGGEATNITFALVQFLDAKANDDWATACARLYSVLRESVEKQSKTGSCPDLLGALMGRTSQSNREEQAKIDVSSVRRGDGNRAFVIYKTPDTLSADMPMYVEDGVWKVGALEAYVLRPDQVG